METLRVTRFLGLKEIEIEISPITILIGQQASGKSVLAKLLYHFRGFSELMIEQLFEGSDYPDFEKLFLAKFCEYFPINSWAKDEFEICYSNDDKFIKISKSGKRSVANTEFELACSNWFRERYAALKKDWEKRAGVNAAKKDSYRQYQIREVIANKFAKMCINEHGTAPGFQLFIPAGRAFFAILQNNIFSFLSSANAIDPFLGRFGQYFESIKHYTLDGDFIRRRFSDSEFIKDIEKIKKNVLCGDYIMEKGKELLRTGDGRKISLANASSGQQEALPLYVMLNAHALGLPIGGYGSWRRHDNSAIYIEEPEAHLFPESQKHIVDLIATIFNQENRRTSFFLTTHSPYVLSSFNNLLLAGRYTRSRRALVKKSAEGIVSSKRALARGTVCVYAVEEGRAHKIMDDDIGLIDSSIIDRVSNGIGREFEQLLSLGAP